MDEQAHRSDWPHYHIERCGPGRKIILQMRGPWLFDGLEELSEFGGVKQSVRIGDFAELGKGLVIGGMSQLSEAVDPVYTSALVFPAATSVQSRKRWLIAGGGDGPAAREALRFADTTEVVLADPSLMVIAETQRFIPSFWGGCQSDPRLTVITRDAFSVMREMVASGRKFDVVVADLTDPKDEAYTPFSESTADHLYTLDGIQLFRDCLADGGVFVAQAQELSLIRWQGHARLRKLLENTFANVWSYRIFIEFFGYWESFLIASNEGWAWAPVEPKVWPLEEIYRGQLGAHYSRLVQKSLFALPPLLDERIR